MEFRFDADQPHQARAIAAAVDLFQGQPLAEPRLRFADDRTFPVVPNVLDLSDEAIGENLREVLTREELPEEDFAAPITEEVQTLSGARDWSFQNFSLEMETGTGKTYVYIRTALELCRRYGLRKFIIVVPSVAIREGVLKTFNVTRDHFAELFDNLPYHYYQYDADRISVVRQFALSDSVEFMVMTIDSFNRTANLMRRESDRMQGERPIHLVQEARPVLLLDEPQNMETETAIRALCSLTPLFALRYSATHKNPYNLIYRLTPADAYDQGLVKQIEVAGVERETDANQPFLKLVSMKAGKRSITARLGVHVLRAGGGVREKTLTVRSGSSLEEATGRPEYADYHVDEINPATEIVRFTNNVEVALGETRGADREAVFDSQIRYTVREHLLKQRRLRDRGIKVVSLFFIDRVANYAGEEPVIRRLFDAAFDELKMEFEDFAVRDASEVRAGYFATKRRRGGVTEYLESRSGTTAEDRAVFDLIMRDKERLLDFAEPVSFIFSHSALREGWDNPNVFQICTLNQSVSEMRKRQEIGRGIRLAVDQTGARVADPSSNVLTVIANESYERYVERYQSEIAEDFGTSGAGPRIRNARRRKTVRLQDSQLLSPEFETLWEKIRTKTRYSVRVDSDALVDGVVRGLKEEDVRPVRIRVAKARVVADENQFTTQTVAGPRTLSSTSADGTLPELLETMVHLLEQASPPLRVTRRTLVEIFRRSDKKAEALANPHEWATAAVRLIRENLADQLVDGIKYEKTDDGYEASQFRAEIESWSDRLAPAERSIYDHIPYDSETEHRFVERLESDERTRRYLKLPGWFTVSTPVGNYNPDWAIVREERDEHGNAQETVYLVAETKSTLRLVKLRPDERRKIVCGERHFADALDVRFDVARSLADLDIDD